MTNIPTPASPPQSRAVPEPLPANITSVQPGGGVCYRIELLWGKGRRWYLKRFRPEYVKKMASLRVGSCDGAPHEILDPRDLKYCRNRCTCAWAAKDDPFQWREKLFFARWGLAEMFLMGTPLVIAGALAARWHWLATIPFVLLLAEVVSFFRNPPRTIPTEQGIYVSPADGKITHVERVEYDPYLEGPGIRISIFLSIFNVHLNRSPCRARVMRLAYSPGAFISATNPESSIKNENMWIGLEESNPPYHKFSVRQIAGAIARRIVCGLRSGEELQRGQIFGMIKLGSRTDLLLFADERLQVVVKPGDKVRAGSTVLARYQPPTEGESE